MRLKHLCPPLFFGGMFLTTACLSALSLVGRVVSQGQMMKTAKVLVTRHVRHPLVQKVVRKRKTYLVRRRCGGG